MILSIGRRRRMLIPSLFELESRRLLSVTVTANGQNGGQDGTDLVGPTVSVGPDGIQDIHLHLSNLQAGTTIQDILVTSSGGFEWEYNNGGYKSGYANAEFFYPSTSDHTQGDLYINPVITGSSGTTLTLRTNAQLSVTVSYSPTSTDSGSTPISGLAYPPLAAATVATPANVQLNTMGVTNNGQETTGGTGYSPGWVDLGISGLASGKTIAAATLSDQAGFTWYYPTSADPTGDGAQTMNMAYSAGSTSAQLYFAPIRNEAVCPAGISKDTDMMLRVTYQNDSTQYVTRFQGAAWDPSQLASKPDQSQASTLVIPNTDNADMASDLINALLNNHGTGNGEYDVIELPANTTITLTQALEIEHPVKIIGNGATLLFQASWSSSIPGAIYTDPGTEYSADETIDFENFNIAFTSTGRTWYDPENFPNSLKNTYGGPYAVINLDSGLSYNSVALTLSNMSISGPSAYDSAQSSPSGQTYVGEPATGLVFTHATTGFRQDSGTITNCVFQGGTINLSGGPWDVTGNTVVGIPGTYSLAAFSMSAVHDLTLANNNVSQNNSAGYIARLMNSNSYTYNFNVYNNKFSGGFPDNATTYVTNVTNPGYSSTADNLNAPEVVVTEDYSVFYEGVVGAISNDGWILVLPQPNSQVNSRVSFPPGGSTGDLVVSIVNTKNSDGTTNTLAGEWFSIAQQISTSPPTFLMQSPLPAGKYNISVATGNINGNYTWNEVNTETYPSQGMSLLAQYGMQVQHNTFIGGGGFFYPSTDCAIKLEAPTANQNGSGQFSMPRGWTVVPSLGNTIEYNTIVNSTGGMILDVVHDAGVGAGAGRVYETATVDYNTFEWTQTWLDWWFDPTGQDPRTFYGVNGGANDPKDHAGPPSITVGSGLSAYGRYPATVGGPGGGAIGPRGFVDPSEINLTIQGNSAYTVSTTGVMAADAATTGQVYAGIVNGVVSPSAPFPYNTPDAYSGAGTKYNNQYFYAPYDADNLNITGSAIANPGITAVALNQDGADVVGKGQTAGADGILDEHVRIIGLNPTLGVTKVDLTCAVAGFEYNAPFGSNNTNGIWRAELVRQGLDPVGDLYFELNQGMSPSTQFTLTVTYSNNSTVTTQFTGVSVGDPNAAMPSFAATSLNQDNVDLVNRGGNSGPDGIQDVDIQLSGLNTALGVTHVSLSGPGLGANYYAPFGSNNTDGSWRGAFVRQALSPVGDFYFEVNQGISPSSQFTITVTYSNGTTKTITFSGVSVGNPTMPDGQVASPNEPMPTLSALSLNQDGVDLVGQGPNSEPDGTQDVDIQLNGLNTSLGVTEVDVEGPGVGFHYFAPFGNYNTDGSWRGQFVRQGLAPIGDFFLQLNQGMSPSAQFTVTVTYSSGATQSTTFTGVTVTNPFLSDNTAAQSMIAGGLPSRTTGTKGGPVSWTGSVGVEPGSRGRTALTFENQNANLGDAQSSMIGSLPSLLPAGAESLTRSLGHVATPSMAIRRIPGPAPVFAGRSLFAPAVARSSRPAQKCLTEDWSSLL